MGRKLPERLHDAYDWTKAGGELDEFRSLRGEALDAYCRESAANAAENGYALGEADLYALALWLQDGE